jgi:hypothetical protein
LAIDGNSLKGADCLLEPLFQFGFQFGLCPQGERLLGTPQLDVLADQPDDRLDEPVAGSTARGAVPILLYNYGGEPRHTPEVLEQPFQHFCRVGYVTTALGGDCRVQVDASGLDLVECLPPPVGLLLAQRPILSPPASATNGF